MCVCRHCQVARAIRDIRFNWRSATDWKFCFEWIAREWFKHIEAVGPAERPS